MTQTGGVGGEQEDRKGFPVTQSHFVLKKLFTRSECRNTGVHPFIAVTDHERAGYLTYGYRGLSPRLLWPCVLGYSIIMIGEYKGSISSLHREQEVDTEGSLLSSALF